MNVLLINHHLFQEGDTYGLIYALVLSKDLGVSTKEYSKVYGLFYINGEEFEQNTDGYKDKVIRRLEYFSSFGLLGNRLKIVICEYSDDEQAISLATKAFAFTNSLTLDCVHVRVNKTLFKSNPRLVALVLTGVENDPRKSIKTLSTTVLQGIDVKKQDQKLPAGPFSRLFSEALATLLQLDAENKSEEVGALSYGYISRSTDYIELSIRERSFLAVSSALRKQILESTQQYSEANGKFLIEFMKKLVGTYATTKREKEHYSWQTFKSEKENQDFVVVLFWIRGAKQDEFNAIFHHSEDSVGKPQHHTNLTLYKYIRALTVLLGKEVGKPFLFVPIGDELKELLSDESLFKYKKGEKAHNLIKFFTREPFVGKPMGAQINFLLQLAMNYQTIQVGMRSGSMERLMYLGVPTVYFDRSKKVTGLVDPVGDSRIKQLCSFQGAGHPSLMSYLIECTNLLSKSPKAIQGAKARGFPLFFHIENMDTGFLKYSDIEVSWESNPSGWVKKDGKWVQGEDWVKKPATQLEKTIKKLMQALSTSPQTKVSPFPSTQRYKYNQFKKTLVSEKNYLIKNLEASKKYVYMGGLNEAETLKFCSMLWFMSAIYPRYNQLYGESSSTEVARVDFGKNKYSALLGEHVRKQEELIEQKQKERLLKKQSTSNPSSSNNEGGDKNKQNM